MDSDPIPLKNKSKKPLKTLKVKLFPTDNEKIKLKEKSRRYEKKVIIVDESYTSCTCGVCGHINNTKGNEVFKCSSCNLVLEMFKVQETFLLKI
jgi:rubrerythrin